MATRFKSRTRRSRRYLTIVKPSGSLHPRVQKVGPEHFGIVAVDCAKASAPFKIAQVLANEARARIGLPRQQGQAGGIGYMACEIMARNCSKKNLNAGKIAATLSRANQIIQRKSIDQREQTLITEENPPSFPWSIPTGELTPWPPQHRSKPTASMPKRAPGRKRA